MGTKSKQRTAQAPDKPIARTAGQHVRLLDDDIRATAARARNLAAPFDAAPEAYIAALWSDLGKASDAFQRHVRVAFANDRVNHSFVGAWYAQRSLPPTIRDLVAAAIAGTHAGLPDLSELPGICAQGATYSSCLQAVAPDILAQRIGTRAFANARHCELFTRLIFSAHVDADRAEARAWEASTLGQPLVEIHREDLPSLHARLLTKPLAGHDKSGELASLREALWHTCQQASALPLGWYQLSAPASILDARSLACYAIGHAVRHGARRVILICATQAALERRVEALHEVVGDSIVVPVAFDHRTHGLRASIEDWGAPIIAMTQRDLVSLLFDNRPASCRHLHHIASAVLLVEDAWRLPAPIATEVVDSLKILFKHFRSTVTFVSTLPYPIVDGAKEIGMPAAFRRLEPRTQTIWPTARAAVPTPKKLLRSLRPHPDCLVVWNSARALRAFASIAPPTRWLYLSSRMCPAVRRAVLRTVHDRKSAGKPVRLATDVIGETIDVTFEVVWREMSDLPGIAVTVQRADAGDLRTGVCRIFQAADLSPEAHVTRLLLLDGPPSLTAKDTWDGYARDLKLSRGRCVWTEDLQRDRDHLRFRTIAAKTLRVGGRYPVPADVALGEASLVPIVVPGPQREGQRGAKDLIKDLAAKGPDPTLLQQLMDFVVWVSVEERTRYIQQDRAHWVANIVVCLRDTRRYDHLGLRADP